MESKHPVLRIQNLEKTYTSHHWLKRTTKSFTAVNKISFDLHKGEILGLLGPNGAGKTTTIQMLLGTLTPTSGSIRYFDRNFKKHRSAILEHVSFASAYAKLPGRLTVYENLSIYARLYKMRSAQYGPKINNLLGHFGISELRNQQTRTLSAGQMTRVMLVKAFMIDPDIVLLDEPTASLDPDVAHTVRQFILQQQHERKIAILFTSHNMNEVEEVCDRILVLKSGNIIANDTPERLAASIATSRVELIISHGMDAALKYAEQHNHMYTKEKHSLIIEVDEKNVSKLLSGLAKQHVAYSQISIEKPTLEDYFIHIARNSHHNILNK